MPLAHPTGRTIAVVRRIEAGLVPVATRQLAVRRVEVAHGRHPELRCEGKRRDEGPRRECPVIGTKRDAARAIAVESAVAAPYHVGERAGAVARADSPRVRTVASKAVRV